MKILPSLFLLLFIGVGPRFCLASKAQATVQTKAEIRALEAD